MAKERYKTRAEKGKRIKAPSSSSNTLNNQKTPVFCLNQIDRKYCLSKCEKDEKAAFADTLHKLSQLTWSQILSSGRHGCGLEKIERNNLGRPIPDAISKDAKILAFRFCGMAAMTGYRDGRVFHVIWLDRQFKLYDH